MGKKIKEKLRGFWNDSDGIDITDVISLFAILMFSLFVYYIVRAFIDKALSPEASDYIFKIFDKVAGLVGIIIGAYYGRGIINKIGNHVNVARVGKTLFTVKQENKVESAEKTDSNKEENANG